MDSLRTANSLLFVNQTFAAGDCNVQEGSAQAGTRRILRFTTKVPNVGLHDLDIGNPTDNPADFEWGACHGHWHYTNFSAYRMWPVLAYADWHQLRAANPGNSSHELLEANPTLASQMVAGHKQGFCLVDVERRFIVWPALAASNHPHCSNQGITPGWADVYGSGLDGQFIDITGLSSGVYVLEIDTNPAWRIAEAAYDNNAAALLVPIP